ncbi:MAG TPA: sodium:proton antiporter [Phycisphaerae bacterium]|nr:sodium:proton antiporter [Phycisphaerae bacterium]
MIFYASMAVAGWLLLVGLYGIVTSRHLMHLCLCLTVLQSATYVMLTGIGNRRGASAPVYAGGVPTSAPVVDPVVQALMLTDIVVEATVVALLLAITLQVQKKTGSTDPDNVSVMKG